MSRVAAAAHLEVVARTTPELVERVCRVLRHRGATVEGLVAGAAGPGRTRIEVRALLVGDVDLLVRQIGRLPDVHLVRHRDCAGETAPSTRSGAKDPAPAASTDVGTLTRTHRGERPS